MAAPIVTVQAVWEGSSITLLARIQNADAALVLIASVSALQLKLFDISGSTPDVAEQTADPVVSTSIFDTLSTANGWTKDTTGWNFKYILPVTWLAKGDREYCVELKITASTPSGTIGWAVWTLNTTNVRSE